MLKRQRAISPPYVPFVTPDTIDMSGHHSTKRRRVAAPILDGEKRGWGVEMDNNEFEDGGAYSYDDDDDDSEGRGELAGKGQREDFGAAETYKSTNSVLHDLHALYQHRMMFSDFSSPTSPPSQPYPASSSSLLPSSSLNQPYKINYHVPAKSMPPPISDRPPTGLDPHEVHRVKERYENTNRYVS